MARKKAGLTNERVSANTRSVRDIVKDNTLTYFNFIFLILTVLVLISRKFNDLAFLPLIIANTCIGIFQEIHSKRVLDRLSVISAPKIKVIREDTITTIPSEKLVLDDVFILERGDQICADAEILEGNLTVNESLLTGESDEIEKTVGDSLLSGSFIINGNAKVIAKKVGKESYASKLTLAATKQKKGESSIMLKAMDYILKVIGFIIIPLGVILFIQSYVYNAEGLSDSISGVVAALTGMIPEGLYLLTSVALAVSAVRLSNKKVLVHNLRCIETLARVDCLCVDKTGTVTEPHMLVCGMLKIMDTTPGVEIILSEFASCFENDNETMRAIQSTFNKAKVRKADKVLNFSSKLKYSAAEFKGKTYVLGAPEFVLRHKYSMYKEEIENEAKLGRRILVFCEYDGLLDGQPLVGDVNPLCFISLENPIREGAKETFGYFASQGVEIKVISGDNPLTVSRIAREAGIEGAENYVDAKTLKTKEDIKAAVKKYTVFGRVVPEQKRDLVRALKAENKTVAMTGDGVNDILALNEADCSIAMASGSEACANAAKLVLLDSDFRKMPSVVNEGRRVVNNVQRTASLYLAKNVFSLLLAIFSVSLLISYPLTPAQVSLISMFTIGIPSFVLALEPNKDRIQGKFIINVLLKALPAAITDFLVVSGLVLFCREFAVDANSLSTSCTILVAMVGFMIIYYVARPMKLYHWLMIVLLVAGCLYCMIFIGHFFEITAINRQNFMLMIIFAIAVDPLMRYLNYIFTKILNIVNRG